MFMYKLNLQNLKESNWIGSKITKKIYFIDAKFKNLKFKDYPFWRIDKSINKLSMVDGIFHIYNHLNK